MAEIITNTGLKNHISLIQEDYVEVNHNINLLKNPINDLNEKITLMQTEFPLKGNIHFRNLNKNKNELLHNYNNMLNNIENIKKELKSLMTSNSLLVTNAKKQGKSISKKSPLGLKIGGSTRKK
jgi:hypothetical protein